MRKCSRARRRSPRRCCRRKMRGRVLLRLQRGVRRCGGGGDRAGTGASSRLDGLYQTPFASTVSIITRSVAMRRSRSARTALAIPGCRATSGSQWRLGSVRGITKGRWHDLRLLCTMERQHPPYAQAGSAVRHRYPGFTKPLPCPGQRPCLAAPQPRRGSARPRRPASPAGAGG